MVKNWVNNSLSDGHPYISLENIYIYNLIWAFSPPGCLILTISKHGQNYSARVCYILLCGVYLYLSRRFRRRPGLAHFIMFFTVLLLAKISIFCKKKNSGNLLSKISWLVSE